MSSKSVQIIGGPLREHAFVDSATNALLVKVVNPGGGASSDVNIAAVGGIAIGATVPVSGTVAVTQSTSPWVVSGTVAVSNFPATQVVDQGTSPWVVGDGGGSLTVDGTVSVTQGTSPWVVGGTVAATQSGAWSVAVSNFPATVAVTQSTSPWVVGQATHDNLNANANLQVGDVDVSAGNPVPVSVLSVVPGTGATNLGKALGNVVTVGDVGVGAWAMEATTGNYAPLTVRNSQLMVTLGDFTANQFCSIQREAQALDPSVDGGPPPVFVVETGTPSLTNQTFAFGRVDTAGSLFVSVKAVVPGTGATNLGKAEDALHASGDVGVMALAVRSDTPAAVAANGDYHPLLVDNNGRLSTHTKLLGKDGGTDVDVFVSDDATAEGGAGFLDLYEVNDDPGSVGMLEGRWHHPFMTTVGGIHVHVGNTVTVGVFGSVAIGSVVPGVGATNLGKAEDAVAASGDTGVMALAVRADTAAATGANGDYVPLLTDSTGRLHCNVSAVVPGTTATALGKAEDAAHTTGDTGVMALAVRRDTLTALADTTGDYIPFATNAVGALWVKEAGLTTLVLSGSTRGRPIQITGTTSGGANTLHTATTTSGEVDRLYLYLTNTSTSSVVVTIEFGTTGTGNELNITVPAKETVCAVDGAVIGGAATDTIKAYAATASVVNAFGRVERLS